MVSEASRSRRRILVIDDDAVMRELLSALLEVLGYEVSVAQSGEQAVALLHQPDAPVQILTDLQMPGLEGVALISALRQAAPVSTVLVGMSGSHPSQEILRSLDAFLSKPFEVVQLETTFATAQAAQQPVVLVAGPPRQPENGPVLDDKIFSALAQSFRPEHLRELYNMTLRDVEQRHAQIEQLASQGDLAAVQREAHAVKGACGFVGARELQALAAAVEGGTTLDTSAIAEFPSACARLRGMLDAKLQQ